jgi:hypothetical protein
MDILAVVCAAIGTLIGYFGCYVFHSKDKDYETGRADGYKAAMEAKEKDAFSKDEKDMIRQIISIMAFDGGSHENKEDSK